ncbi:BRO family protein [Pelotomaculum propionicicum]|uniref:Uncharacterized protein n=1 Tax=Pelotomaculum propionicicum TaxID=258475 RepID=A0A4Y7RNX6_9FIRM|nr:BRO family protein [Pelotomaculum propionicicum]TEB10017.1 hypothetical protein Pmgp_02712 [Pelotomaculum propionicicum]
MENVLERTFEGRPVRLVTQDEEVLVPLPDIARALDYGKEVLWRVIDRNKKVFEEGIVVTTLPSEGGPQKTTCLTRDGVVGLLMKLATNRIKDLEKRQLVVNFQRWAIRTIGQITRGELVPVRQFTEDSGDKTKVFMTMTGLAQQYLSLCEAAMKSSGIDAQAMGAAGELLQGCLNLGMSLLKGDMYSPATVSQCKITKLKAEEMVMSMRQNGYTLRQIAGEVSEATGVQVTPMSVSRFLRQARKG